MDEKLFYLLALGFIFTLVTSKECPKECQCYDDGSVDCDDKNINNEQLAEILKELNQREVTRLSLKKNSITNFKAKRFVNFTKLHTLLLGENNITTLRKDWFAPSNPKILGLLKNPLICDCVLYNTLSYFRKAGYWIFGDCNDMENHNGNGLRYFHADNKLNCSSCSVKNLSKRC